MQFITKVLEEKRLKIEVANINSAENFYIFSVRKKVFKILYDNYDVNQKLQSYYSKALMSKRRRVYRSNFFIRLKRVYFETIDKLWKASEKLNCLKRNQFIRIFIKGLKINSETKKDEKLKQSLIEKLQSKAQFLLDIGSNLNN